MSVERIALHLIRVFIVFNKQKTMRFSISILALACSASAVAQNWGRLGGGLESNNIVYVDDSKLPAAFYDDDFGSHDYLKLDYTLGGLAAGVQLEGYLPALRGYDIGTYGDKFMWGKYLSYTGSCYSVRLGDIYEQYGSGMILRTYEDRTLGFNNSIEGVHAAVNFGNYVAVRGLFGRPRLYTEYADTRVGGADLSVSVGDILGTENLMLYAEGSYVYRSEDIEDAKLYGIEEDVNLYSARINAEYAGAALRLEYVGKSDDLNTASFGSVEGKGFLAEVSYSRNTLSALASFRKLKYMSSRLSFEGKGIGNVLNYLPALTRQHTYMLANINPYQSSDSEIGGQLDIYYSIRNSNARSKYWNLHFNGSTFYSDKDITTERRLLWREIDFDIERKWGKNLKTTFLYSYQKRNATHGYSDEEYTSNVFVLDGLYKLSRKMSLRAELQYLSADDMEKDWVAALAEFSFAPHWSVAASDMYNCGRSGGLHYYNVSACYTYNQSRLQVAYGRSREGYVCSGGVCRYSPAYTGLNITLSTSF